MVVNLRRWHFLDECRVLAQARGDIPFGALRREREQAGDLAQERLTVGWLQQVFGSLDWK